MAPTELRRLKSWSESLSVPDRVACGLLIQRCHGKPDTLYLGVRTWTCMHATPDALIEPRSSNFPTRFDRRTVQ